MNPFDPKTCGFACPEEHKCLIHGHDIPETAQLYTCGVCGNKTLEVIVDSVAKLLICPNCYVRLSTCYGCQHGQYCAFEQDPTPIPKVVIQTIRKGNMITQMQVKNPERIKICCSGCVCYINDSCERENSYCSAYKFIYDQEEKCDDKISEAE